jgi:suppressor of cytokine signaling 5
MQVDYTNFLIPCQSEIFHCPFYWGKIDRYEAEAMLANKPEGSFLFRDSAQVPILPNGFVRKSSPES